MNDFTKEELKYIFYCVDLITNKNDEHNIYEQLENKLQSMIDNYYDHECNHEFYREESPLAKAMCCDQQIEYTNTTWSIPRCHKCGRILNE